MSHPAALAASALKTIFTDLSKLTVDELTDLVEGRTRVLLRPIDHVPTARVASVSTAKRTKSVSAVDIDQVAKTIIAFSTPDEVMTYLDQNDKAFTVPVLKGIANALGPTIPKLGSTKAALKRSIAQGTAGFQRSSTVVRQGSWNE